MGIDLNEGKCDSCKARGPRLRFRNVFVQPVIEYDLCGDCMQKAMRCMAFFFRTPAGRETMDRRKQQMTGT